MTKQTITALEYDNALRLANFAKETAEKLLKCSTLDKPEGDNPQAKAYLIYMRECAKRDAADLFRFANEMLKRARSWKNCHAHKFIQNDGE